MSSTFDHFMAFISSLKPSATQLTWKLLLRSFLHSSFLRIMCNQLYSSDACSLSLQAPLQLNISMVSLFSARFSFT